MRSTTADDLTKYGSVKGFRAVGITDKRAGNGSIIWQCRCEKCGSIVEVTASKFKRGEFTKCQTCSVNEILAYGTVNGLRILRKDEARSNNGKGSYYICKCENCGAEVSERVDSIKRKVIGCRKCADRKNGEAATIEMTGMLFGRLRVICLDKERSKETKRVYWKCLCNCGNPELQSVRADSLRGGKIQSCGCLASEARRKASSQIKRYEDLTGKKFGHLTAIEPTGDLERSCMIWRCQCDCTNHSIVKVSSRYLKRAKNINCGCVPDTELVGMQFDFLKVIRKSDNKAGRQTSWDCICTRCGSYVFGVPRNTLVRRGRISCGCLRNNYVDLTGRRFGHLTVVKEIARFRGDSSCAWLCKCDCGNECERVGGELHKNMNASCGCTGRSDWHSRWQGAFGPIREILIGDHRPDYIKDDVAFEFQHSRISNSDIEDRNSTYLKNGFKVVWVIDGMESPLSDMDGHFDNEEKGAFICRSSLVYGFRELQLDSPSVRFFLQIPEKMIEIKSIEVADTKKKGGNSVVIPRRVIDFNFSPDSAKLFVNTIMNGD